MSLRGFIICALVLSALTLRPSPVRADSVRYLSDASEPFDRRVVAEIESVGLEVEQPSVETDALPDDCVALIRVSNATGDVEVWLRNAGSLSLATKLRRDMTATEEDSGVRIAEAVRGILAPLAEARRAEARGPLPPPPEPLPASVPVTTGDAAPPANADSAVLIPRDAADKGAVGQPDWEAAAALGGVSQTGGIGASILLGLRRRVYSGLWADVGATLPVVATTLEAQGASADVQARLLSGTLSWDFRRSFGLPLRVGAGATFAWIETRGQAAAPRRGVKDTTTATLPHLTLLSGVDITPQFAAEIGALAAYAVAPTNIAFGADIVGHYGRPLLIGHVGILVRP